jgi:hypothetical protein
MRRRRRNHFGTATDTNLDGDPPVLSMLAAAAVMAHPVEQCSGRSLCFLCLEALRAMIEVWVEVWESRPHTSEGPYYRPAVLDRLGLTAADDAKKLQFQMNVFGLKVARIVPKGVVHDH